MSASTLIVDIPSLKAVADSIASYTASSQTELETAMRGLQTAEGCWSDEDMRKLQESLQMLFSRVEQIGSQGMGIVERCNQKIAAVEKLHNLTI